MIRIIPRIDIKGPNLVKGINLEGLRVLGTPEDYIKFYYKGGADELIFQDVVASLYGRNSLHEIISRMARKMFIPITVGGGLRSLDDIKQVLRAGADKVTLNTAAIRDPRFIKEASLKFGASTIVISIETIKYNGRYLAYIENGREETGLDAVAWARQCQDFGAGEILLTSVDRDGTGKGYDLELLDLITQEVTIPVIINGGAGELDNIRKSIIKGASGLSIASSFHYYTLQQLETNCKSFVEGNTTFLNSGNIPKNIKAYSISEVKAFLMSQGFECRPN
jgi:cyclase